MSRRSNHATRVPAWMVALLLTALACADSAPLPGYVPDPDEYTVPADAAKVREVPGSPGLEAPVDHLLLVLETDAGREVAESIAASEGGTIVGQIPALRFYQLKLPTETMEALLAAVDRARVVPGVDAAGLDPVVRFSSCPAESDIDRLPTSDLRCPWESCAILDRWDRLVANTDAPKTVLVRSSLEAVVELNLPDEEDLRVAIRGSFAVPFESFAGGRPGDRRVEFDVDDPVLRTLEATCEGGRR